MFYHSYLLGIAASSTIGSAATQNSLEAIPPPQKKDHKWKQYVAGRWGGGRSFHLIVGAIQHPVFVILTCYQLGSFQSGIPACPRQEATAISSFIFLYSYSLLGYNYFALAFSCLADKAGFFPES